MPSRFLSKQKNSRHQKTISNQFSSFKTKIIYVIIITHFRLLLINWWNMLMEYGDEHGKPQYRNQSNSILFLISFTYVQCLGISLYFHVSAFCCAYSRKSMNILLWFLWNSYSNVRYLYNAIWNTKINCVLISFNNWDRPIKDEKSDSIIQIS